MVIEQFKHSDKTFVAGENRIYIGELPPHLAHIGVPRDVARNGMFKLIGREGNMLHFKTGTRMSPHARARCSQAFKPDKNYALWSTKELA